jgi:hypothetical protein
MLEMPAETRVDLYAKISWLLSDINQSRDV